MNSNTVKSVTYVSTTYIDGISLANAYTYVKGIYTHRTVYILLRNFANRFHIRFAPNREHKYLVNLTNIGGRLYVCVKKASSSNYGNGSVMQICLVLSPLRPAFLIRMMHNRTVQRLSRLSVSHTRLKK